MNRQRVRFLAAVLLIVILATAGIVLASSTGDLAADWFRFGPGGVTYCTHRYTLASAIGQPMVGELTGGSYTLVSGVQMEATDCRSIALPVILK